MESTARAAVPDGSPHVNGSAAKHPPSAPAIYEPGTSSAALNGKVKPVNGVNGGSAVSIPASRLSTPTLSTDKKSSGSGNATRIDHHNPFSPPAKRKQTELDPVASSSTPQHGVGFNGSLSAGLNDLPPPLKRIRSDTSRHHTPLRSTESPNITPVPGHSSPNIVLDADGPKIERADDLPSRPALANRYKGPLRYTLEWSIKGYTLEKKVKRKWTTYDVPEDTLADFHTTLGSWPNKITFEAPYQLAHVYTKGDDDLDYHRSFTCTTDAMGHLHFESTAMITGVLDEPLRCSHEYDLNPDRDLSRPLSNGIDEIISSLMYRDDKAKWRLTLVKAVKIVTYPRRATRSQSVDQKALVSMDERNKEGPPAQTPPALLPNKMKSEPLLTPNTVATTRPPTPPPSETAEATGRGETPVVTAKAQVEVAEPTADEATIPSPAAPTFDSTRPTSRFSVVSAPAYPTPEPSSPPNARPSKMAISSAAHSVSKTPPIAVEDLPEASGLSNSVDVVEVIEIETSEKLNASPTPPPPLMNDEQAEVDAAPHISLNLHDSPTPPEAVDQSGSPREADAPLDDRDHISDIILVEEPDLPAEREPSTAASSHSETPITEAAVDGLLTDGSEDALSELQRSPSPGPLDEIPDLQAERLSPSAQSSSEILIVESEKDRQSASVKANANVHSPLRRRSPGLPTLQTAESRAGSPLLIREPTFDDESLPPTPEGTVTPEAGPSQPRFRRISFMSSEAELPGPQDERVATKSASASPTPESSLAMDRSLSRWTGEPSNRTNPHSRANLLPVIDRIYEGNTARAIVEDEHRIWLVRAEKEMTDASRFFCTTWARFIQEHGTIPFIRQEQYMEHFFEQYGPVLHYAQATNTVLQHLVRLYRNRHFHEPLHGRRIRDLKSEHMMKRERNARDTWLRLTRRWNQLVSEWDERNPPLPTVTSLMRRRS